MHSASWSRRTTTLLVITGLITMLPGSAGASWTQPGFMIGGYYVGSPGDTARITKLNNAGIDFLSHEGQGFTAKYDSLIRTFDVLRARFPSTFKAKLLFSTPDSIEARRIFKDTTVVTGDVKAEMSRELALGVDSTQTPLLGWKLWDEPPIYVPADTTISQPRTATVFSAIKTLTLANRTASANVSSRLPFVNLFGINARWCCSAKIGPWAIGDGICSDPNFIKGYKCYLDLYLSLFNSESEPAPVLSSDYYPFQHPYGSGSEEKAMYFMGLAALRDKSMQYSRPGHRVPFWQVIQSSARCKDPGSPSRWFSFTQPTPTFNQIRWQAYVSLAYGAKGIVYWTTLPWKDGNPNGECYGPAYLDSTGAPTSIYTKLVDLNKAVRAVGDTLFNLDPIAAYHNAGNGFMLPLREDSLASPNRIYNIVTSITGSDSAMFGYFKNRVTGADYLLVVNKSFGTDFNFTVTLGNSADAIDSLNTSTRAWNSVAGTTSFTVGNLAPGAGRLFRITDKVYEYIPNVNKVLVAYGRHYFAHEKGVVMVNTLTGRRTYERDGVFDVDSAAYTPVKDLAIHGAKLYIGRASPGGGHVVATNLDMDTQPSIVYCEGCSPPGVGGKPVASLATSSNRIYIGENVGTSNGKLVVIDSTWSVLGSKSVLYPLGDVVYQSSHAAIVVSGGDSLYRLNASAPFNSLARKWNLYGFNRVADAGDYVYAGFGPWLSNSSSGLMRVAWDFSTTASTTGTGGVADVAAFDPTTVLVGFQGYFAVPAVLDRFARLSWSGASPSVLATRNAANPRAVAIVSASDHYLATNSGVIRTKSADLAQQYRAREVGRTGAEIAVLRTDLHSDDVTIRFVTVRGERVQVELFDVMGRRVRSMEDRVSRAGAHDLGLRTNGLGAGLYFVRVRVGSEQATSRLVVTR